jgi:hypothetical protein
MSLRGKHFPEETPLHGCQRSKDLMDAGDIPSREDRSDRHIAEKGYSGLISSEMKIFFPAGVYF